MLKLPSVRSLLLMVVVLAVSVTAGFLTAPDVVSEDATFMGRPIKNMRGESHVHAPASLEERHGKFRKFLVVNSRIAFLTLVAGTVCFAYPAVHVAVFGFVVGVLGWHVGSLPVFMKSMLPHSLTEIPTILYYSVVAQDSGWKWIRAPVGSRMGCFKGELISNLKLFVVVIPPLVLLNATLEAYVTGR